MVTGIGGGGHGEQILKALRMSTVPYEIVGCDMSQYSKGFKYVDHKYILPPARDPNYLLDVLKICKKHRVRALFHGSEPELLVFSKNQDAIRQEGIFLPVNPQTVIETCMRKSATMEFLREHGFSCPAFMVCATLADLEFWDHFPAILKPSIGSGGSAHTFVVQNREELNVFGRYVLESKLSPEIIIQEYVGTPENEYTVSVLFDMDGNLLNSICVKRDLRSSLSCRTRVLNRTGRMELGPNLSISTGISQGEVGPFPEISNYCEKIGSALHARGVINIQCRKQGDRIYIFEINPRFSGTTSIKALVGFNEPDILLRKHILGEDILPRFAYRTGVVLRGLEEAFFDKQETSDFKRI